MRLVKRELTEERAGVQASNVVTISLTSSSCLSGEPPFQIWSFFPVDRVNAHLAVRRPIRPFSSLATSDSNASGTCRSVSGRGEWRLPDQATSHYRPNPVYRSGLYSIRMARAESLLGSPFVDQAMKLDISTGMIPLLLPQENDVRAPALGTMFDSERPEMVSTCRLPRIQ